MVTEIQYKCPVCGNTGWSPELPNECPDCAYSDLQQNDSRERDASNGECSVGTDEDIDSDIDCNLIATYEADVKSDYDPDGYITRKICDEHKRLWENSKHVIEIREL